MKIDRFRHEDIPAFLALSAAEGWISERWEFEFLLRSFPQGGLAGRVDGRAVAFVTAIRHDRSGWIGNLIVAPGEQGKGYGTHLFRLAFDALGVAGVRTVWLTASAAGRPIYQRLGFREVDVVKRWRGKVRGAGRDAGTETVGTEIAHMDRAGWGDGREELLSVVVQRGTLFADPDGFLVSQPCGDGVQFGPWGCAGGDVAGILLDRGLSSLAEGTPVLLDVPVRNVAAASLLYARGFAVCGTNSLMYAGCEPAYDPERVFALATFGSMG